MTRRQHSVNTDRGPNLIFSTFPENQRIFAAVIAQALVDARSHCRTVRNEARAWLDGVTVDGGLSYAECRAALEPVSKPALYRRPRVQSPRRSEPVSILPDLPLDDSQ